MKQIAIILLALAFISSVSFAQGGKSECKACGENGGDATNVLQDSAAALQKSNPDLAKGLSDYANEEAKEKQEWKERKDRHEARTKLLTDSAAALEKTNPDLAEALKEMSEHKHDKMMHEMKEEKNEKEERNEKY